MRHLSVSFLLFTMLHAGCGKPDIRDTQTDAPKDALAFLQLPVAGTGYYTITDPDKLYGVPDLIDGIENLGFHWSEELEFDAGRIGVNDISYVDGSEMPPHSSHRTGKDVDLRPLRLDGREYPTRTTDSSYSREFTAALIKDYLDPNLDLRIILFNDPQIYGHRADHTGCPLVREDGMQLNYVKCWSGHANHLHVSIK